jgi:ParB family chromosome partitioning protein
MRLLSLPYEAQKFVAEGKLSEGHAKVLLSLKNPEKQLFLAKEAMAKQWSVRALEEKVKAETQPSTAPQKPYTDPELEQYKKFVEENLGASVDISGSKEKGKLAVTFYSQEELKRIIDKLSGTSSAV